MTDDEIKTQRIVLFDGICNLCNGSVIFVLKRERNPSLRFASIQSIAGRKLLEWCGLPSDYNQAVVYIQNGKIYIGLSAVLRIGQDLIFPWSILSRLGLLVPKFIREVIYNRIAQNRYRWFGKREICMVPTDELKARFL